MKLTTLTIALLLGLTIAVGAEQTVKERVKADAHGEVDVENVAGRIRVEGWSEKAVEVTGVMGDELELRLERKGMRTVVSVKYPQRRGMNHQSADLLIRVPVASLVSVETVSADIEGRSLGGQIEAESVSGSIELDVQAGEIEVESVSGDVELRATKGEVEVASVSGDLEVDLQEGHVEAETISGDVDVRAGKLTGGDVQSVSGDIKVDAALASGSRVDLEAHSGDIDLILPADTNAEIDLEAYSGSIRNRFGGQQVGGDNKREVDLELGSGGSRVEVTTFSGDITVSRK